MGVGLASAGISLGVFIGVAASFVYIILAGIKWASERLDPPQDGLDIDHCARCGSKFIDVEDGTCSMCDLTVCAHCSVQYRQTWLCATCIKLRDAELIGNSWILSNFREKIGEVKLSSSYGRRECDVRDFVEKLIENILGGRLDNVRIDYLTEDSDYVDFMERYEDVLSLTISRLITSVQLIVDGVNDEKRPSPRKIHDQLKSLIADIIVDASSLKVPSDWEGKGRGFGSKTYEDILSTAILNKIVQNVSLATFRSSTLPASEKYESPMGNDTYFEEKGHDFPLSHFNNNSSPWNRRKSGMWPEFDIDILDDLLYSENKAQDIELWKENWVLSKKSNESSVAMLIPSPNGKVRPLIGDLEVDQLSDLSDIEDQNFTLKENRKNRINSKTNGMSKADSHADRNENANIPDRNVHNVESKPNQLDYTIVEARNSVFSSTYNSDDEETKKEKDRDLPEVTHTNTTRVTICHMERKKDTTLDRKDGLSVRQLAKKFSEQTVVGQVPHSVHSLTGRNLMRELSQSPLHTNIEYWEGKAKPEKPSK